MSPYFRVYSRRLLVLGMVVVFTVLGSVVSVCSEPVELAQTSAWNQRFGEIRELYYDKAQTKPAIQMLEDQIDALGNTYPDETLNEILAMVKDYFVISKDYTRFQTLTYNMLEPNRVSKIVNYYTGTPLYDYAKKARSAWMRPASASIRVDTEELDINESTGYSVSAKNQEKVSLSQPSVTVKVTPEDRVRLGENTITALSSGPITIEVFDADGNSLAKREISVREGLGVTVSPDHVNLEIKANETFTIQSNKPFTKFDVKWALEPPSLATGKTISKDMEAGKELVMVTAVKSGTTLLKVTDAGGASLAQAAIYIPPVPPSKLWPLVTSGATVLFAVYAIIQMGNSNDKFDEHEACIQAGTNPDDCNALYDDYKSAYNKSTIGWVLTGVGAVGSGYLWYKWWKAKKAYEEKLNEGNRSVSLFIDPTNRRVTLGYSF